MRPGWRVTFTRFLLLAIQPWRHDPEARDALTWVVAVGDFFLGGVPAFFIWKAVDAGAEVVDLVVRFIQMSLVLVVIGVTWAGLRLQRLRDWEQTPRVTLSLEGKPIIEPVEGIHHDYWIAVRNDSRTAIRSVTLRIVSLSSLNGTHGIDLYAGARFHKQVLGGSQPIDIPVGATVRWDILTEGKGRQSGGSVLCCDAARSAPASLTHHSHDHRYSMVIQAYGDDLQDIPEHRIAVEFWTERVPKTSPTGIQVLVCRVMSTPVAR